MPNIVKELSLNKHPKDCKDLSLINARNIMVSNDFSCLQNELNITNHPTLTNYLKNKILVGYIPCNTEIVLFVCSKENYDSLIANKTVIDCTITRYDEETNEYLECIDNFKYYGGKIVGTFTYNVQSNLIIAVAESDTITGDKVPLRSINLGKFDEETKGTDRELDAGLHAVSPELIIPKINDFSYVPGSTYKGWYYFFVRYKINNVDYTHWFPIGYPIFICDIEKQSIFKYGFKEKGANTYTIAGAVDYFSSKSDISKETVNIKIDNLDITKEQGKEKYKFYQIGFICVAKDSSKAFRSNDLPITTTEFTVSIPEVNSYSVEELILDNYNYYNVKNVINYQNRLYISNYKEYINPKIGNNPGEIKESDLAKIKLKCIEQEVKIDDYAYQAITVDANDNVDSAENLSIDKATTYEYVPKFPYYKNNTPGAIISSLKIGDNIKINHADGDYTETGYIETNLGTQIPANVKIHIDERFFNITIRFTITATIHNKQYKCEYWDTKGRRCSAGYNDFENDIFYSETGTIQTTDPLFINTNHSFNQRKKDTTLIPGEIYSFYIHFVNKYGESTDGYRIPNKFGEENIKKNITLSTDYNAAVEFPINQEIFNENGDLNTNGAVITRSNVTPPGTTDEDIYLDILSQYYQLRNISNIKWFQMPFIRVNNPNNYFIPFINDNGDILYKVPIHNDFTINDTTITYPIFKIEYDLNGFKLPEGYIGYYFSYEKFEPTIKSRGILTKRDASNVNAVAADAANEVPYNKYNNLDIHKLETIHFYSSSLDINDNIDLDFNSVFIIKQLNLHTNDLAYNIVGNSKVEIANAKFPANLNKPEIGLGPYNSIYAVDKASISIAGDALKDKRNLGTSIEISVNDIYNIFTYDSIYKVALMKLTTNIYMNENKVLIKFTDVEYAKTNGEITRGLNGHFTYNNFIVYDFNRFIFNSQNNLILNEKYGMYYKTDVFDVQDYDNHSHDYETKFIDEYRAPLFYVQLLTYDTILNEAKSFKTEPLIYYLQLEKTIESQKEITQTKQFAQNLIVLPENTVDLFENKYPNQDALNPKTFVNYDNNKSYLEEYNKRVRRSNIIADESNENSWRIFPLEGYKDITENKGIITNVIGIGTTFLVHTEHSLFMFDRNNTLQTADKEVQLAMPDIFDVDYKEVFTSDLGICGLQDRDAHIVDQFGYIFYDNDAHRIYKFGQGKIDNIDLDIVQFLNKYKPYRIRFANDKESNRLLVNMYFHSAIEEVPQEVTISFNYVINKWISFHDYVFDAAFNTKQMVYYLINRYDDNVNIFTNIYVINDLFNYKDPANSIQNIRYNKFENIREEIEFVKPVSSVIDIICNSSYEAIKYLEYISYKLYKIEEDNNIYSPTPVEELKQPYSGNSLRVFNSEVDTGLIDILIDNESPNTRKNRSIMTYKKPWWELGNWNFNYLRNNKDNDLRFPSRLYGNYFIIRFVVKDDYRRIEFESLDYQVTKDKP